MLGISRDALRYRMRKYGLTASRGLRRQLRQERAISRVDARNNLTLADWQIVARANRTHRNRVARTAVLPATRSSPL